MATGRTLEGVYLREAAVRPIAGVEIRSWIVLVLANHAQYSLWLRSIEIRGLCVCACCRDGHAASRRAGGHHCGRKRHFSRACPSANGRDPGPRMDEIQVQDGTIEPPGEMSLTLHNNYTAIGSVTPAIPGGITPRSFADRPRRMGAGRDALVGAWAAFSDVLLYR
jgi:hypothetical protein